MSRGEWLGRLRETGGVGGGGGGGGQYDVPHGQGGQADGGPALPDWHHVWCDRLRPAGARGEAGEGGGAAGAVRHRHHLALLLLGRVVLLLDVSSEVVFPRRNTLVVATLILMVLVFTSDKCSCTSRT